MYIVTVKFVVCCVFRLFTFFVYALSDA